MSPNSLNDPDLAALEAELFGKSPRLTANAQQAILYQAAFRAGKALTTKSTRIWQTCAAGLGLILATTLFPWKQPNPVPDLANRELTPKEIPSIFAPSPEELPLGIHGRQRQLAISRESWKPVENKSERFDQELKKFALLDLKEKAHSLIQLTRLESVGN